MVPQAICSAVRAALDVGMITRRCGSYCEVMFSPCQRKEHVQTKVLIEIEKIGPDVHVYYTLQGDEERLLLREKKGFALPVQAEQMEHWRLGAMVCGPLSDATQGLVQEWNWEVLPDSHHH